MLRKGFTLIELLIVVAIIAILAAIAVPNFLEAQVRAKVSRSKNDQRSIATAIEAYAVDNGDVPLGPPYYAQAPWNIWSAVALRALTTPVAFMTSVPQDVFRSKGGMRKGVYDDSTTYEYGALNKSTPKTGPTNTTAYNRGYVWTIQGAGPARIYSWPGVWPMIVGAGAPGPQKETCVYDPSNGTVSQGWIVRTNKGVWDGDTTK